MSPPAGLSRDEARRRLAEVGPNVLAREAGVSPLRVLLRQFRGPMVWLLLAACVVSALVGEVADAIAIGAILLLNGVVGFLQEHRAERAVQALRSMTAPRARVLRDGRSETVAAAEVVPDDVLVLEAGDVVAADARLLEAHHLSVQEAALTGESLPVDKRVAPVADDAPLAERSDCVFAGTAIAHGAGLARVFATGMGTELGRIAHLLQSTEDTATPLQRRLVQVGRTLLYLCLGVVALVALLDAVRGVPWFDTLMQAVSLAVAAVPEGLAAVVTIALAVGVQRMVGKHVLVRRLPAVETLGCTTVICADKTGTLTTGVMIVREVWGPDPDAVLDAAAACCTAELGPDGRTGTGDPSEVAILAAAAARGIHRDDIEQARPAVATHPFDAERKRMSIARADGRLYVKGAVESVLPLCQDGAATQPSAADAAGALPAHADLAERGLRVLAVAVGRGPDEQDLTLLGLVGLADPPRPEAVDAVAAARAAGIRTVLITGDHPVTARAIALELGIVRPGDDEAELVHARATPEDKLRIVRTWKQKGDIVAMTGDGVNDAPALREAHVGIAMGRTGTEVTREAADVILTDDNFASIVAAVQQGRGVYDNIRKTLVYLLAGNASELLVVLGAVLLGLPAPLLPLHLLWINLVTDGLPALALAMDPASPDLLQQPPRPTDEPILGRPQWRSVLATGVIEATLTLAVFAWTLRTRDLQAARTLAFSVLVFSEVLRSLAARSPTRTYWQKGVGSNPALLGVIGLTLGLQIGLHHVPATQELFRLGELSPADAAWTLALGLVPVSILEVAKLVRGRFART